jgi:transposase
MDLTALFPQWCGLCIIHAAPEGDRLTLVAYTTAHTASCPLCQQPASSVHSRYQRRVADLPCGGRALTLVIHARRFFCRTPTCPRRTFRERLPALIAAGARRSHGLLAALTKIGIANGGKPGARLAHHLGMPASHPTLLRLVRAAPLPFTVRPEVIGVDDWAWKKGRRYGTIFCDLARGRVVDLLPERSADSVAAWLDTCPAVRVIARDRSDLYADGARRGAPHARQIADRFHLLKNLGETLDRFLQHKRAVIRQAVAPPAPVAPAVPAKPGQPWQQRQEEDSLRRHAVVLARYQRVIALHAKRAEIADIARAVGISRTTVYRYLRLGGPPERKQPRPRRRHHKVLDPYEAYLLRRWEEGCHTATRLWREIRGMGYQSSYANVVRFLAPLRLPVGQRPSIYRERGTSDPTPTPRQVAMVFLQRPERLSEEQQALLRHLCEADAAIAAAHRLANDFATIARERQGERLDAWIADAIAADIPDLRRFALGLLPDKAAILAGLSEKWSNGPTEGHINRLKTLKRQMYGRAKFDLLRQRLLAPQ